MFLQQQAYALHCELRITEGDWLRDDIAQGCKGFGDIFAKFLRLLIWYALGSWYRTCIGTVLYHLVKKWQCPEFEVEKVLELFLRYCRQGQSRAPSCSARPDLA